jgi:hypothetical protein
MMRELSARATTVRTTTARALLYVSFERSEETQIFLGSTQSTSTSLKAHAKPTRSEFNMQLCKTLSPGHYRVATPPRTKSSRMP